MSAVDEQTYTVGIAVGFILVVLGVGAYVLTGFASVTALIPAIFGVLFVALANMGRQANRRAVAVYGLGLLALLGLGGSAPGVPDVIALLTGGDVSRPVAAASQAIMAVACVALLVQVGRSIAEAR